MGDADGLLTRMALTRKGLPVARRLLRVLDATDLAEARRQLSGDAAKLARSKGGKALLPAAKVGDISQLGGSSPTEKATSKRNTNTPRQQLMLETMIISDAGEHGSAPDQER